MNILDQKLTPEEAVLVEEIHSRPLPNHIAIIMDGNGRWAKSRNWNRIKGHKAGITSVQHTVEACVHLGIKHLTLYAFSQENWKRPTRETGTLMALLRQFLRMELKKAHQWGIRIRGLGATQDLAKGIQKDLRRVEAETAHNHMLHFNIALNYSGRDDILSAVRSIIQDVKMNRLDPQETINEGFFSNRLSTAGQPDPDLLIRTSGEFRVSNFLLWQIAYSEIYVTPLLWPDFRRCHLFQAIIDFQKRDRRYGGV